MMASPSGRRNSEPVPVPSSMGSAPSMAAKVVMRMGRKRSSDASKIASRGGLPCSRSASSAKSTIMIVDFALEAEREQGKRSEEHTSELQSPDHLVCRLLLEKKNKKDEADVIP